MSAGGRARVEVVHFFDERPDEVDEFEEDRVEAGCGASFV